MPTYKHKVGNLGGAYSVDADLDNVQVRIKEVPEVQYNLTHLPRIEFGDIKTNSTLTSTSTVGVTAALSVKELPKIVLEADTTSNVNIAIKEIPDVRAHLPAHYDLGISLFGVEIIRFSLCGESQFITEKYKPRSPEVCR